MAANLLLQGLKQCRAKFSANLECSAPGAKGSIILESLVLPEDQPLETLPPAHKEVLSKGSAKTIVLA